MTIKKRILISLLIVLPVLAAIGAGIYFMLPKAPAITSINLKYEINLEHIYIDEPFNIQAEILPENANKSRLAWYSTNPAVATVDSDGKVTPVGMGFVTITAISLDDSSIKRSLSFYVKNLSRQLEMSPLSVEYDGEAHQTYVEGWQPANGTLIYKFTGTLAGGESYTPNNETTRTAPTDAGVYRVSVEIEGTGESNYTTLTITPKPVSVSVTSFQKEYLDPSPEFTYGITGLVKEDSLSFQISGGNNENVRAEPYILSIAADLLEFTLDGKTYKTSLSDASSKKYNYTVSNILEGNFAITQKTVRIKILPKTSTYGEPLVPLEFEIYDSNDTLLTDTRFYESILGQLRTIDGNGGYLSDYLTPPDAKTYTISTDDLSSHNLSIIQFENAQYTITKRVISVYPNAGEKFAGSLDPVLSYSVSSNSVNDGTVFNNILVREGANSAEGELVGLYNYHLIDHTTSSDGEEINSTAYQNYTLKLINNGHVFSILQNRIQIIPQTLYEPFNLSQSYAENTILTGSLAYTMFINGKRASNTGLNSNGIELINGDRFKVITKLQTEDSTLPPEDTYKIYNITAAQEEVNFQDNFTFSGNADINKYDITFGTERMFVQKIILTLTVNPTTKTYGDSDPTFTYSKTGFAGFDNAENSIESVTYSRSDSGSKVGNTVGDYPVSISSVSLNSDKGYYKPVFVAGILSIIPKNITLNTNDYTLPYGAPLPNFAYSFIDANNDGVPDITLPYGDTNSDVATGSLSKNLTGTSDGTPSGLSVSGNNVGVYDILDTMLVKNANYQINYTPKKYTITKREVTIMPINLNIVYGDTLPQLLYNLETDTSEYGYDLESPLNSLSGEIRLSKTPDVYTAPDLPLAAGTYYFDKHTLAIGGNFHLQFNASGSAFIVSPLPVTLSFITKNFTGTVPDSSEALTVFSSNHGGLVYDDSIASLSLNLLNEEESMLYKITVLNDPSNPAGNADIALENINGDDVTQNYLISLNLAMNTVFERGIQSLSMGISATAKTGENTPSKPFDGGTPWTFGAEILNSPEIGLHLDPNSLSFKFLYPNGRLLSSAPINAGSYLATLDLLSLRILDADNNDVTSLYSPTVSQPVSVSITPIAPTLTSEHTLAPLTYGTPYSYDGNGRHKFVGSEISGSFNVSGNYYTTDNSSLPVGTYPVSVTFEPDMISDIEGGQFKNYTNTLLTLNLTINPFSINISNTAAFSYTWTGSHPTYTGSAYTNTISNLNSVLGAHASSLSTSYHYYGFTFNGDGSVSIKKDNDTSIIFLENFGQSSFTIENNTGNFVMEYSGNKKIIISVSGTTLIARYDDNGVIWNILNTYSGTAPRFAGFYISAATIAANDSNVTLGGKTSETFYSGYSIKKAAFSSFTPNNLEFEYMAALDLESCTLTPNPSGTLITTLGYSKTGLSFTSDVPVDAGGYFVKLSANQANYYSSQTFEFEIIKADISAELISPTDFDYDGNPHQPNYNLVWGESDSISSLQIEELNTSTIPQSVWDNEDWALVTALNGYLTTPINSIKQAVMLKTFLTSSSLNITFGGTQNNGAVYSSIAAPSNAGSYFMNITVVSPNFTGGNNKLSDSRKRFYIDPQSAPNLGINFESTNVAKDSLSDHTELYEHIIDNMINTTSICLTFAGDIKTHLNSVYNTGATLVEDRKFEVEYLYDDDNDSSTPLVTRTAWVYADLSILGGYPLTYANGNSWYNAINSTIGTKSLVLTLNFLDGNTQKIELRNTISINRITLSQQHFTAPDGAEYDYINQNIWGQLSRTSSSPIPIITDFSPSGFSQNEALYHNPSLITIRYQYKQNGFTLTQAPRDIGEYTVVATITVPSTSYYIIDNSSLKYEYSFTIIASTIYNNISDETISVDFKNEAYDADDIYDILSLDYEILTRAGGTAYALTFGSNPQQAENGLTFRVLFNSQSAQNLTSVTVAGTYTVRLLLIGSFGDNITDATNLIINFNFIIEPLSLGETVNDVLSHISNEPPFEFTYDAEPDISLDETPYGNAIDELYDTLEIAYFTSNDDNDPLASRIDITNGKSIYADPTVSAPTIYFRIISSNDSISPSFAVPITLYKQNIEINNITVDGSYALNGTITEYYNNNAPVEADKSRFSVVGLPEASGDDFVVEYFVANQWTAEAPTGVGTYNLRISLDATWYKTPYNQYKYFTFVVETTNDVMVSAISFDYSDFINAKYLSDDPSLGDNGYLPISFYSPSNAAASAPTIYYEGEQLYGWWLFTLEDMNAFLSGQPSLSGIDFNNAIAYVRTQTDYAHELAYFNNIDASLQAYIIPAVFVCNNPNISAMTVYLEYTVNKKVVDLSNSTTTLEVDNIHLSGITGPANNMIYHYNDMDIGGDYSVDLGVVGEYILDGENGNNASISLGSFTITSNNVFNTFNSGNTLFTPLNPPVATFESKNYTGEIGVVFNLTKPSLTNLFSDAELSRPFSNSGITGTTNQTALLNSLFGSSGVEVDPKTTILQSAAFSFEGNSSDLSFIAAMTNSGTYTFEATFEGTNYYETTSITVTYTIAPLIINPVLSSTLITDPATDSLTVSLTVINPPSVFGLTTPAPNVILSAATIQDTALTEIINNNWQFVFDISSLSNGSYSINISAASGFDDEIVFGTSAENPITLPIPFIIDKNMDMDPDLGAVFFNESLSPDELLMQLSEFYGYGEGILASAVWLNNVNIDEDTSWTTNTDNHLKETNYILSPLSVAPLYYEYRKNLQNEEFSEDYTAFAALLVKQEAANNGGPALTPEEMAELTTLQNKFASGHFVTSWNLSDGIYFGFNGGTQSFGEDGSLRFENMPVELTFNSGGLVEIKVSFTLYFDFELRYNNPSPFIYTGDAQGPTDSNFEVYTKGFLYTKTNSTSDFEPIDNLTTAIPLVSYSPTNHTNAGSYSATATYTPDNGCPKTYSLTVPFVIEKQPLSVTMPSKTVLYSGEELDLTDWATASVDGDVSNAFIYYHGNSTNIPKNAGTYTIKAEWNGNPNYIGTAYATLIILPVTPTITLDTADIENPKVLINGVEYNRTQMLWASVKYYDSSDMSLIYDSTNQTEVPQLVAGNNYIITVGINQSNIATNNNFLKTIISLEHSLPPSPPEDPEEDNLWINLSNTVQVYDGTAKSIEAVLMNGNSESDLELGVDYTLTAQYFSNGNLIDTSLITNSGTYSVVVTVELFELDEDSEPILDEDLNPIVASTLTVNTTLIIQKAYLTVDTGDTSKVYDNTAIIKADFEANITVEAFDASGQLQTLTLLTDYRVTILNGNQEEIPSILNAGFYTIMLTPIGDYESNYEPFTFKFTISQAAINFTLDAPQINGSVYDGSNKTISVNWSEFEAAYGVNTPKPTLTWSPNAALISPSSTGASVKNAGIYSVTATISNNINFIGTASVQFEILKRQLTLTQKVFEEYWLPDIQWTSVLEDAFVISGKAIGDTIVINAENFSLSVGNGTWNNPINAQTYTITLSCINTNYTGAITFNFKIKKSTISIKYQNGNNALINVDHHFKSDGYTSNGDYDFFEFDKLRYVYNGDTSPEAVKAVIDNLSPLNISTSNSLFEYTEEKDINIINSSGASIVSPNHRIKGHVSMGITISLNNDAKDNIEFESETKTDVTYEIIVWE